LKPSSKVNVTQIYDKNLIMPTYLVGLIETPTQKQTFGEFDLYNSSFEPTHGSISKYLLF